ncbi:2160_t:CDS:2, partial [Paraglomus occultum]
MEGRSSKLPYRKSHVSRPPYYYYGYLNHETVFQRRSAVSVLQLIRRRWGYVLFVVTMIILVTTRIRLTKQPDPFEETPAMTGHSTPQQPQKPRPPPLFSTFTDNYPKQLAVLIVPTANTSLSTYCRAIVDTWATEKEDLKQMMAELLKETMVFKEPEMLSDEQDKFRRVTKALHFLYSYHLHHYNYFLKVTDRTFVRLPRLLDHLNSLKSPTHPRLIGNPQPDSLSDIKFCSTASGYIFSKGLLAIAGAHLPFCLEDDSSVSEDKAMSRCLTEHVPKFEGCQHLPTGTGRELLSLRPDDEISWNMMNHPEETFDDGFVDSWRFSTVVTVGEVSSVNMLFKLNDRYGVGGKYDKLSMDKAKFPSKHLTNLRPVAAKHDNENVPKKLVYEEVNDEEVNDEDADKNSNRGNMEEEERETNYNDYTEDVRDFDDNNDAGDMRDTRYGNDDLDVRDTRSNNDDLNDVRDTRSNNDDADDVRDTLSNNDDLDDVRDTRSNDDDADD